MPPTISTLRNSIVYGNSSKVTQTNVYLAGAGFTFTNCCVAPLTGVVGADNTDQDPLYQGPATGDYRLQAGSPCVNTGTNQDWMSTAVDLDGHARLDRFSGQVDMGAFEHVPAGALMKLR